MYTVIIVDDEEIVREGIRKKVRWNEFGFDCIGTCENGRDAKIIVDDLKPDIVFSDIYMPYVSGLELAEYIYNSNLSTKTIIFTGYDDFNYIQKALKLKVIDYILKPVTSKEIENLLGKLKIELDFNKNKALELKKLELVVNENKKDIKNNFLNKLLNSEIPSTNLEDKLDFHNICLDISLFMTAVLDIDEGYHLNSYTQSEKEELYYFCVNNISEEIIQSKNCGIVFQNNLKQSVIIFNGNYNLSTILNILNEIVDIINKNFDFTITIGLGNEHDNLSDLAISYNEAKNALEYRTVVGNNKIVQIKEVSSYLYKSRESYSKKLIESALSYIKENFCDQTISINKVCKHVNISSSYFSTIFKAETNLTFVDYLTQIRIDKAKDLLVTTNLKSYEIAEKIGYSDPHYFSISFKKNTGFTPTNYREMVLNVEKNE